MIDAVSSLLRDVAATVILPRFRRLDTGDVRSKSPGEEVTIVDEEAERRLTSALRDLLPGSIVVGEEAAAQRPDLLDALGTGSVWLVDPLDGTSNFVAGDSCFAAMVCLLRDGESVAAWMLSPVSGHLHVAEAGGGAWIDGTRCRATQRAAWGNLRGSILTRFLPPELKDKIVARATAGGDVLPGLRCAGEEYPAIAQGVQDFAIFWRALPWDHAPGILFLEEAGGRAAGFDGRRYRPADHGQGIMAARTPELWDELARRLLDPPGKSAPAG